MERLTEKRRFKDFRPDEETTTICVDGYFEVVENYNVFSCGEESHYYLVGEAIDKLAEYEEAEEQGLLLRLPCKVGDTVYCFDYPRSDIVVVVEEKIEKILIYEDDLTIETDGGYYLPPMFGKLIFTTRAEAEAALEKMKGEEHE